MASHIRVYADTSDYGGVFDEEFGKPSRAFFDQFRDAGEIIDVTDDAIRLQAAYLRAGILTPRSEADALHVALATTSGCRLIVSWNFKHIVNFKRIPLYNGVNMASGYGTLGIHTPSEVVADEDEDV